MTTVEKAIKFERTEISEGKSVLMDIIDSIGFDSEAFCEWSTEKAEEKSLEEWKKDVIDCIRNLEKDSVARSKFSIARRILDEIETD